MDDWNPKYASEARLIAADVVHRRGFQWKAEQIAQGKRGQSEEVEIAMRALMVARGDISLRDDGRYSSMTTTMRRVSDEIIRRK